MFCLPWRRRTKCDCVVSAGTREGASGIIVGVAIGFGAYGLEHLRVHGRLARGRVTKRTVAAILRFPERAARALARVAALHPQLRRAPLVEILAAASGGAGARAASGHHHHGQIVAVDEADVVVVHGAVAKRELGERGRRRGSGTVAVDLAGAAVGGGARSFSRTVELATGSAPESTGPTGRSLEAFRTSLHKFKTCAS